MHRGCGTGAHHRGPLSACGRSDARFTVSTPEPPFGAVGGARGWPPLIGADAGDLRAATRRGLAGFGRWCATVSGRPRTRLLPGAGWGSRGLAATAGAGPRPARAGAARTTSYPAGTYTLSFTVSGDPTPTPPSSWSA